MMRIIALFVACLMVSPAVTVEAFAPTPTRVCFQAASTASRTIPFRGHAIYQESSPTRLFLQDDGEEAVVAVSEEKSVPAAPAKTPQEEGTQFPINLPSPLLLATSMVLAIGSTGSLFQLSDGTAPLGFTVTAIISAIGFPLCGFLFYASILKATAETEEDDKKFLSGRRK